MTSNLDGRAADLTRQREGVITHRQALEVGFTQAQIDYRIKVREWTQCAPRVYIVGGAPPTWRQSLWVAVGAAGPGSAASHRAAATLHGLDGFPLVVEITTPRPRRYRSPDAIVHTSTRLEPVDIERLGGLPVTTPTRTLIDLGAVIHADRVEEALDAALRDGKTTLAFLARRLEELRKRGRRGCGVLAELLEERAPGRPPESRYERIYLRALREARLPLPEPQFVIRDRGRLVGRTDFAWPEHRLVVEIDGHRGHSTRRQRQRDARRENQIKLLGWQVLRFTTDQVWEQRDWVVDATAQALLVTASQTEEG